MSDPPSFRVDEPQAPSTGRPPLERAAVLTRESSALDATELTDRIWRRHERWRWLRIPAVVAAIAIGSALVAVNPRRDPQRVVDVYAPGVTLGAPVSLSLMDRIRFQPTPASPPPLSREFLERAPMLFVGVRPSTPDGLAVQAIAVGGVPRTEPAPPVRTAPVSRVALSIPSPDAAVRVERRLRDAYGRPETRCFAEGIRTLYWRGNRHGGALLVLPTRSDAATYATPFAARVVLGARVWETNYPRATACARE